MCLSIGMILNRPWAFIYIGRDRSSPIKKRLQSLESTKSRILFGLNLKPDPPTLETGPSGFGHCCPSSAFQTLRFRIPEPPVLVFMCLRFLDLHLFISILGCHFWLSTYAPLFFGKACVPKNKITKGDVLCFIGHYIAKGDI
jgi:hypothetical protein